MTYDSSGTYRYRFPTVAQQMAEFRAERPDCPICGDEATDIDHDHSTGTIRGHLCRQCNFGLGNFKDDPLVLQSAALYLNNYEETGAPVTPEWSQSRAYPARLVRLMRSIPPGQFFDYVGEEEGLAFLERISRQFELDLTPVVFS